MNRSRAMGLARSGRTRTGRLDPARPAWTHVAWSRMAAAAVVAVTIVAYAPALGGDFLWDDDDYVSANPVLGSWQGLAAIWFEPSATPQYYPLVHTSFWLEHQLWGLRPTGYHVVNLLLHLACGGLVWRILRLLAVPGAGVAAAVFLLHPVHVESVAWITERKNVLSGVFYLAAMLVYLRHALGETGQRPARRRRVLAVTGGLFLCALLSKTTAATLPAALLLLTAWRRGRVVATDLWPLAPMAIAGIALGLVTVWLERVHVGAQGIDWQLSLAERVVIAGRALWFYAATLVWPVDLAFMYPRWSIDVTDPTQLAYPLAALAVVAVAWLARRRVGSGPLVAVLLFGGTLVPALGFFDVFPMRYTFVANHYQYLASVAFIALVVAAATRTAGTLISARVRSVGAATVIAVLALLTWRQSPAFADHEALWRDSVAKAPGSWMGQVSLGALLERRGALGEAELHYRESVRLKPDFATARTNLGALLANQNRLDEALPHMREAAALDPGALEPQLSYARALVYAHRAGEAAAWLERVVARWPDEPLARALFDQARRAGPTGAEYNSRR